MSIKDQELERAHAGRRRLRAALAEQRDSSDEQIKELQRQMLQTQKQLRAAEAGDASGAGGKSAEALGLSLAEVQRKLELLLKEGEKDATKAELRAQTATLAAAHSLHVQQQEVNERLQAELGEMREKERKWNKRESGLQSKLEEIAAKKELGPSAVRPAPHAHSLAPRLLARLYPAHRTQHTAHGVAPAEDSKSGASPRVLLCRRGAGGAGTAGERGERLVWVRLSEPAASGAAGELPLRDGRAGQADGAEPIARGGALAAQGGEGTAEDGAARAVAAATHAAQWGQGRGGHGGGGGGGGGEGADGGGGGGTARGGGGIEGGGGRVPERAEEDGRGGGTAAEAFGGG